MPQPQQNFEEKSVGSVYSVRPRLDSRFIVRARLRHSLSRSAFHVYTVSVHRKRSGSWMYIETEYGLAIPPRLLNPNKRASRRFLLVNRWGEGENLPRGFASAAPTNLTA